jgi:chromosome segregation ATPase
VHYPAALATQLTAA